MSREPSDKPNADALVEKFRPGSLEARPKRGVPEPPDVGSAEPLDSRPKGEVAARALSEPAPESREPRTDPEDGVAERRRGDQVRLSQARLWDDPQPDARVPAEDSSRRTAGVPVFPRALGGERTPLENPEDDGVGRDPGVGRGTASAAEATAAREDGAGRFQGRERAEEPGEVTRPKRLGWQETLTFAKNESIASILLKLERVPSRSVAILATPDLAVFRNAVSMRLLQRRAEDLGLDITLISNDRMTRQLCAEIGFGCYSDASSFRRENAQPHYRREPRVAGDMIVAAVAGLAFAILAGFMALVVLPSAAITITPVASNLAVDVPVVADSSATSVDLANSRIPAKFVSSGDVDGSVVVNATGQRDVPSQPARGFVTFTNLTAQPLAVPKSTIVTGGKIAFATVSDTQVGPSISIGSTAIPGTDVAAVQAVEPGEGGNVPVGAITAVQGALSTKVSVINHSALTGGAKKKATYLSSDDQAKARQLLLTQLLQQALDKIRSQTPRNETFLPSPDNDGDNAIEEATYEDSAEQVTTQTRLHMKVLLRGLTFQGDDVNQVVSQAVDNAIRQRGSGTQLSGPLSIDPPVVAGNDGSVVKLQVHTAARVVTPLDTAAVAQQTRGLSASEAKVALLKTAGVGDADVELWPGWVRHVPRLAWRIHTTIAAPHS